MRQAGVSGFSLGTSLLHRALTRQTTLLGASETVQGSLITIGT